MTTQKKLKVVWAPADPGRKISIRRILNGEAFALRDYVHVDFDTPADRQVDFDSLQRTIANADLVIVDFGPTAGSRTSHADAMVAATITRYSDKTRLSVMAPEDFELPFDWRDVNCIRYRQGQIDTDTLRGAIRDLFMQHEAIATPPRDRPQASSRGQFSVFLAMPFQGYLSGPLADPNAFSFERIDVAVRNAIAALGYDPEGSLRVVARGRAGGDIWEDIEREMSAANVIVADFSGDLSSGSQPNPNVVTEATLARAVLGHSTTLVVLAQEGTRLPAAWTQWRTVFYSPTTLIADQKAPLEKALEEKIEAAIQSRTHGDGVLFPARGNESPVTTFATGMTQVLGTMLDSEDRLWMTDGEQIRLFAIGRSESIQRWFLPRAAVKRIFCHAHEMGMVSATWDGALHFHRAGQQPVVLRGPTYADVPVHRVVPADRERFFAATWDGQILACPIGGPPELLARLPHLPLHLIPLDRERLAVVDEAGLLSWVPGPDRSLVGSVLGGWTFREADGKTSVELLANDSILRVAPGVSEPVRVALPEKAICFSHRVAQDDECWTAIATDQGNLLWYQSNSMRIPGALHFPLPRRARKLLALRDPDSPSTLCCLGLLEDGSLFNSRERRVTLQSIRAEDILLDHRGYYLIAVAGTHVSAFRNPAVGTPVHNVSVISVEGTLAVNAYGEVALKLRNDGPVPLAKLRVAVKESARFEGSSRELVQRLAPGAIVILPFPVRPLVKGNRVPMQLEFELEDDGGPPAGSQVREISVQVGM